MIQNTGSLRRAKGNNFRCFHSIDPELRPCFHWYEKNLSNPALVIINETFIDRYFGCDLQESRQPWEVKKIDKIFYHSTFKKCHVFNIVGSALDGVEVCVAEGNLSWLYFKKGAPQKQQIKYILYTNAQKI
jgi:hypothetical protein